MEAVRYLEVVVYKERWNYLTYKVLQAIFLETVKDSSKILIWNLVVHWDFLLYGWDAAHLPKENTSLSAMF